MTLFGLRPIRLLALLACGTVLLALVHSLSAKEEASTQYILLNRRPGWGWNKGHPELISREEFLACKTAIPVQTNPRLRIGLGFVFSYFRAPDDEVLASLRNVLTLSEETDTPVYIQI